ncbi:hypothetical protein SAMN05878482_101860 [Peribacillus simplex]|uniref:Uncharacterized protein n=1 Tax=Peribacillus simplex TaxID=1478 RepID=A0A9X8R413_9BACI|nr:hypothetical protein [Peribacillus simplex]SIQ29512.1 hypothetical protein SAMN05878482_101860 [Peribacillus simplex]
MHLNKHVKNILTLSIMSVALLSYSHNTHVATPPFAGDSKIIPETDTNQNVKIYIIG